MGINSEGLNREANKGGVGGGRAGLRGTSAEASGGDNTTKEASQARGSGRTEKDLVIKANELKNTRTPPDNTRLYTYYMGCARRPRGEAQRGTWLFAKKQKLRDS